jgi:hypothetical protein
MFYYRPSNEKKEVIFVIRSGSVLNKKKVATAAARVITTAMTAMLVLFLAAPAFSEMSTPISSDITLQGKVVAVRNMTDLTVLTIQTAKGLDNEVNVLAAPYTNAKLCGDREHAMDVTPGNKAVIEYHELSGLAIADSIVEKC